jgi:hypothetical protein
MCLRFRFWVMIVVLGWAVPVLGQRPFRILQHDTTVPAGTVLQLGIDSTRLFSNFIFSACNPETGRWTVWRKGKSGKYEPVFKDRYNRMNVVVSADRRSLLYVRYKPQEEGAMYKSALDSAWICTSGVDGSQEAVVLMVPEFNKNAVYDLDWSADKTRILYSYGNDQYPSLTRDGDVFEYNTVTKTTVNLTNDWQLWSKNCRYAANSKDIAYSHFANFWDPLPTDVFVLRVGHPREQVTNSTNYSKGYKFCTLTDFDGETVLYRRGLYFDNKLYRKRDAEELLFAVPGYGGVQLEEDVYAAVDFYNNIYVFTSKATIGSIKVSGVKTFAKDHAYNYALDCNMRLNWMGRQQATIRWSTGERATAIAVMVNKTTTYYCKVEMGEAVYTDSITVTVAAPRPAISRKCMTLSVPRYAAYQWLKDGSAILGAVDSSYTPDEAGRYAVAVVDKKGRKVTSDEVVINAEEWEAATEQNGQVTINADPSSNSLVVSAPFAVNVLIMDERGVIVKQQANARNITLGELPEGSYNMMLYNDACVKLRTRRLVKKD